MRLTAAHLFIEVVCLLLALDKRQPVHTDLFVTRTKSHLAVVKRPDRRCTPSTQKPRQRRCMDLVLFVRHGAFYNAFDVDADVGLRVGLKISGPR